MTHRLGAHRQLVPKLEEIRPVQRNRHIECAVGVQHRPGGNPKAARRFAATDLRSEALGHDGRVPFERRRRDEGFPSRNYAISARTGNADDEVAFHALTTLRCLMPCIVCPHTTRASPQQASQICAPSCGFQEGNASGAALFCASVARSRNRRGEGWGRRARTRAGRRPGGPGIPEPGGSSEALQFGGSGV